MLSKTFLKMLKDRHTKKNGELKKIKKAPKWLDALNAERGYIASLYAYTLQIRKTVTEQIYPKLPAWFVITTNNYPDPVEPVFDSLKNDDIIDDIIDSINETIDLIDELLQPAEDRAIESARFFGIQVAEFNEIQYEKSIDRVLEVDIFQEEPWLETQLDLFANQNAELIQNMTQNELNRVSGIIQRGLQEGSSLESVTENIENSFGITRRHARLIARDQTTKLNGSLTKLRQQNLGLQTYQWVTAGDERVRKDHRVLDFKICRWDDPTVFLNEETGKWEKRSRIGGTEVHPSQDVNCRCQPIARYEELFNGN